MRELKFRVWSEDQKTYKYKFPYNSIGDFYVSTRGVIYSDFGNTITPEVRQLAFIVEQYTGLKDKNGKEIYEGDIVRIYNMDNRGKIEGAYIPLFDEMNGEYIWCKNEDIDSAEYGGFPIWAKYRVIGNIHENKELLEGK